jgi:hypothetical protein
MSKLKCSAFPGVITVVTRGWMDGWMKEQASVGERTRKQGAWVTPALSTL